MGNDNHEGGARAPEKKAWGRPRLANRRTIELKLRLTQSELLAIQESAAAAHLSLAAFARRRALFQATAMVPLSDVQCAVQLARIGNILNQAVRLAHVGGL